MVGVRATEFLDTERLLVAAQASLADVQGKLPAARWSEPLPAEQFSNVRRFVLEFGEHCRELGAKITAETARRSAEALNTDLSVQMAGTLIEVLESALDKELSTWQALVLGNDLSDRLALEGKELAALNKLPRCQGLVEDLEEASRCQAVGRSTAVMFHLMRVQEVALSAWANHYGVARTRFRESRGQIRDMAWTEILTEFTEVLRSAPTAGQSEAVREAQLRALRLLSGFGAAWRSPTLMPANVYTPLQSEHAFCMTLDLLRLLATFL